MVSQEGMGQAIGSNLLQHSESLGTNGTEVHKARITETESMSTSNMFSKKHAC